MRIYHEASFQSKPHSFLYTIPLRQNNGDSNDNNNFSTATFLRSILGYSLIQSKAFPGIFFCQEWRRWGEGGPTNGSSCEGKRDPH